MGYNVDLYARQPIQLDYLVVVGSKHYFPRDRQQKLHQCRVDGGWPRPLRGGNYLVEMSYRPAGPEHSNYKINALRRIDDKLVQYVPQANATLYEMMLMRDQANIDIGDDPLFSDIRAWLRGQPVANIIDERFKQAHTELLEELAETGVMNPALPWLASAATHSFSDFIPGVPGALKR
jgi:hypothetical protein